MIKILRKENLALLRDFHKTSEEMKARPVSISLSSDMEKLVNERLKQERMGRSEYFRKCVREEVERALLRRTLPLPSSDLATL
jgi:radical SAM superfamily enzyme with C-terminal helix-hairpin-helix motif